MITFVTVLWVAAGLTVVALGIVGFLYVYNMSAPLVIIVKKGLGLQIVRSRPRAGRWEIGGCVYVQNNKGAHPDRGSYFWRSIYVFDEGSPTGRMLGWKKNEWIDAASLKKFVDKEYINGVITSMMGLLDSKKIVFYLLILIVLATVNVLVVAVVLLQELGMIGGAV